MDLSNNSNVLNRRLVMKVFNQEEWMLELAMDFGILSVGGYNTGLTQHESIESRSGQKYIFA